MTILPGRCRWWFCLCLEGRTNSLCGWGGGCAKGTGWEGLQGFGPHWLGEWCHLLRWGPWGMSWERLSERTGEPQGLPHLRCPGHGLLITTGHQTGLQSILAGKVSAPQFVRTHSTQFRWVGPRASFAHSIFPWSLVWEAVSSAMNPPPHLQSSCT